MRINPEIQKVFQEAAEQYSAARDKLFQAKNQVYHEENSILCDMLYEMSKTNKPLTAAEISDKLDGVISKHEVAGQLMLICNPEVAKRTHPTHGAIREEKGEERVQKIEKTKTRRFAEVNEKGELVPGGKVFETKKTYNTYTRTPIEGIE